MKYFCCTENRRAQVRQHGVLNGIDFVEVVGDPLAPTLELNFLKPVPAVNPADVKFSIGGGERFPTVPVTGFAQATPTRWDLSVAAAGDFSLYTLRVEVVGGAPLVLDPLLSSVELSFKIDCESDFDCEQPEICAPEPLPRPLIDYLAKDYASFRQLILDRLALLMPDWQERNAADLNMALVEILAYIGDYLSYQQDAIATEAYLGTARRRVSVRRHARLVDYYVHDGCNARVWAQVQVSADDVFLQRRTPVFTRVDENVVRFAPGSRAVASAWQQQPLIFETVADAHLYALHNLMDFYTWGDDDCCLAQGATTATLAGDYPFLKAGDVLIFFEERGAETGSTADANPETRHAVRLIHVVRGEDPLGGRFLPNPTDDSAPITEIYWDSADALPFPLCVTAQGQVVSRVLGNIVPADHGSTRVDIVPGRMPNPHLWRITPGHDDRCAVVEPEPVPARFRPRLPEKPLTCSFSFDDRPLVSIPFSAGVVSSLDAGSLPAPLQGVLNQRNLDLNDLTLSVQGRAPVWSVSDGEMVLIIRHEDNRLRVYPRPPAATGGQDQPQAALPAIHLAGIRLPDDPLQAEATLAQVAVLVAQLSATEQSRLALFDTLANQFDAGLWSPQRDLLGSQDNARDFVVETESDGTAYLRFGDDRFGQRPAPQTVFVAFYRVGNGKVGNIGHDTLGHIVTIEKAVQAVRNPLAAFGGNEPESIKEVRQRAPTAFRRQERAVTPEDYAAWAAKHPEVQRASATLRWTGSWHTIFLTVDRVGGKPVDAAFERQIRRYLERYRMAGHDLEVDSPHPVSLEIDMIVCANAGHFRGAVRAALLQRFSSGILPDGSRGVFHPDNFTFGQPVFLSHLIAQAAAVEGVDSVDITKFQRLGRNDNTALNLGRLSIGRLEIARLDNNPNFPERGVFRLTMQGGK